MFLSISKRPISVFSVLACLLLWVSPSLANERSNASFYIDTYGRIDPATDSRVKKAHEIFDRLKQVAGPGVLSSRLVVIDAESKPWAIALSDGNIILSRGALDIVYSGQQADQPESWLAFVLGHELAHITADDLWQQHVFASLSANLTAGRQSLLDVQQGLQNSVFDSQQWRERELQADELGYVFAALAGFEVERIFADNLQQDFLSLWDERTQAVGDTHYSATIRNEFMRVRLKGAEQRIDQFKLGLMMAYDGRYSDALTVFEDFYQYFPSHSALANLGFVHLQQARREMPAELAYRFWIPMLLESESGLRIPSRGFAASITDSAIAHLKQATRYLEQAAMMAPDDSIVSMNLTAAYWYSGQYFLARASVENALKQHPDNTDFKIMKAIVLIDQEPDIDMWPRVVESLEALKQQGISSPLISFNMARLLEERGRNASAQDHWEQLYSRFSELPKQFRVQVCIALSVECELATLDDTVTTAIETLNLPVRPGHTVQDQDIQSWIRSARVEPWQIQEISGATVKHQGATAYLIEGVIELVAYDLSTISDLETLERQFDFSIVESMAVGENTVYRLSEGVTVMENAGQLSELWLMR